LNTSQQTTNKVSILTYKIEEREVKKTVWSYSMSFNLAAAKRLRKELQNLQRAKEPDPDIYLIPDGAYRKPRSV